MLVRIVLSLVLIVPTLVIIGRRVWWLRRLVLAGQPAPGRTEDVGSRLRRELTEVLGQRKLLAWSVPGVAHFVTFWGFLILGITIVETLGALLLSKDFAFWWFGRARWLGFLEDLFACLVLVGIVIFAAIRVRNAPERQQRASRFYGSHTRAAWVILAMIALVILTLLVYRGAQYDNGRLPFGYSKWAFASYAVGLLLGGRTQGGTTYMDTLEVVGLLSQLGVVLIFGIVVVYSKHLHIGLAPLNVATKRLPDALGPLLPVTDNTGKPLDFSDIENLSEDQVFGRGKIEDFTWKGYLDFATCTECGRCQSQCPAWNTGKPLSPKLLIMDLRDHLFAKAPYILGGPNEPANAAITGTDEGGEESAQPAPHHGVPESGFGRLPQPGAQQNERPLVGTAAEFGVIDPDVLWSCTTCGACVEQCPVDIEHVDHITDMRRYQVLVESAFPSEAGTMLRNIENRGNPWGLAERMREDWLTDVDFEVRKVGPGQPLPDDVEYLYWVGCAGALEDRSKKVTKAFAELLHVAGVQFAVLGSAEACTGDPARRLGNEFVFQMQAIQNVETLNSITPAGKKLKIVATCPHCFNTLGREYPQLGGDYDVIHHTQLLAQLVANGHLTPVEPIDKKVTYHDPCYLGRHNKVYIPPREVLAQIPSLRSEEMHRCKERGFCCGAGGARFWMEEKIGKRVNVERTEEALGLDPDVISTACPFCMVMLSDAVTAKKQEGRAREDVAVLDVAQLLQQSLAKPVATAAEPASPV